MKTLVVTAIALSIVSAPAFAQISSRQKVLPLATPIVRVQSLACGIPPIPPAGCRAMCMCDQSGTRCSWSFACN